MIIPRGPGQVRNRQTTDGRMESSGTQMATTITSTAIGLVGRWKQEKDQADTQEAMNTALKRKNEWKAANLTREGKAAEGLTEEYLEFNKGLDEELSSKLSNSAKESFKNWQTRDTEQDKLGVMLHQRKQDQVVKQAAFNEGLSIAEDGIRVDPKGNWRKAVEHANLTLENGVNAGVIPPEQLETKRLELNNKLRAETAKSYYTQDRHDFMKSGINELGLGEAEKAAYQDRYQKDLMAEQREQKSLFAEEARLEMSKLDDAKVLAVVNKDTSRLHESADRLDKMGYASYAAKFREEASAYDKVIDFDSSHKGENLVEIRKAAESLEIPNQLEGASATHKANLAIQREYLRREKQFKEDPGEYVSTRVQGESLEDRASSMLELQKQQGILPKDGIRVTTNKERDSFKATWDTGDIKQKLNLLSQATEYGEHMPKVIAEMGLNTSLSLASQFGNDKRSVELLVAGVSDKPVFMGEESKTDYERAAKDSQFISHLSRVRSMFPVNEGMDKSVTDVHVAMVGVSAKLSDPKAGGALFDSKFKTFEEDDKLLFLPSNLDEDDVFSSLDVKKDEIRRSIASRRPDGKETFQDRALFRNSVWTNTDEGYALVNKISGRSIPGSTIRPKELERIGLDNNTRLRNLRKSLALESEKNLISQN